MTLYQNKYRVETTRLQNWDYASDGWYYITICTKGRDNIFGIIEQGIMQLNDHGHIVEQCWFDLPNHYSNLILDAFVVMPDHVHGIMIIDNSRIVFVETGFKPVSTDTETTDTETLHTKTTDPDTTDTETLDTMNTDTLDTDTDTMDMNPNPQPQ